MVNPFFTEPQPVTVPRPGSFPFHMVVAVADNHVIGQADTLPWKLSSDLQRFKRLTMGHALLMGRRTYESIGRLLPGRTTIILSRQAGYSIPGAIVAPNLDEALKCLPTGVTPFVVGGAEVYRSAWPRVGVLHVTRVRAQVPGDTRLDPLPLDAFHRMEFEHTPADAKNDWPTDYECWIRNETITQAS